MVNYYFYISFLLLTAIIDVLSSKNKKNLIFLVSLTILFFVGLRYKLGVDWLFYYKMYNDGVVSITIEPGYQLLSYVVGHSGISFWFFNLIITFIIIICLSRFYSRFSPYPSFSIACYFIISFGFNVEAIRQVIAVSLFYLGLTSYFLGHNKKYYFYCIAGAFFHASSLIFLMYPCLCKTKNIKFLRWLLLVGLILGGVSISPVVTIIELTNSIINNGYINKLWWYVQQGKDSFFLSLSLLFKLFLYAIFCAFKSKIKKKLSDNALDYSFIFKMEVLYLIMLLVDVYFASFGTIASRLDEFMLPVMITLIAFIIYVFNKIYNKYIVSILFSLYVAIGFIRFTNNDYFQKQYIPYSNFIISSFFGHAETQIRELEVNEHWQKN